MGKDKLEEQNRKPRRLQRRSTETADWQAADAELVKRCISAAAKDGGALRFGYSRDGGAYAVGIYGDGDPYTELVKPSEDIDAFLKDVLELFEGMADDKVSSRSPKNGAK